jgi:hypothetical protein
MYSRIPWKLVADPLGSAEHILGPTDVDDIQFISMLIAAFLGWLSSRLREFFLADGVNLGFSLCKWDFLLFLTGKKPSGERSLLRGGHRVGPPLPIHRSGNLTFRAFRKLVTEWATTRLVKQISPSPSCSVVLIWGKTENCNMSWYMSWQCVLEEWGEPYNTIMRMNKNIWAYVFKKTLIWSPRCSTTRLYTSVPAKGITFRNLVHHFRWSCVYVCVCMYIYIYIYRYVWIGQH